MADFRRGFKSECEKLSLEIREELGLQRYDPLDMDRLAEHLDVEILPFGHTGASPEVMAWARSEAGSGCFSALTVTAPWGARVIVLNESHDLPRRNSNLAHELAQALLLHEPAPVNSGDGSRSYDSMIEREAEFLAGALLVPRPMARGVIVRKAPIALAAARIGISEQMLNYRIQVTGARRR